MTTTATTSLSYYQQRPNQQDPRKKSPYNRIRHDNRKNPNLPQLEPDLTILKHETRDSSPRPRLRTPISTVFIRRRQLKLSQLRTASTQTTLTSNFVIKSIFINFKLYQLDHQLQSSSSTQASLSSNSFINLELRPHLKLHQLRTSPSTRERDAYKTHITAPRDVWNPTDPRLRFSAL